jgi:hypothetical protein
MSPRTIRINIRGVNPMLIHEVRKIAENRDHPEDHTLAKAIIALDEHCSEIAAAIKTLAENATFAASP